MRLLSLFLLSSPLVKAVSIDCPNIRVERKHFNFESLGGPHLLYTITERPNGITNTTFSIDVCKRLEKDTSVPPDEDCPNGSQVCAIERFHNTIENSTTIIETVPIAGEFSHTFGGALDPKWTRLKTSPSSADKEKEGVRLEMNGGRSKLDGKKQKAIVEFECGDSEEEERRRELSRPVSVEAKTVGRISAADKEGKNGEEVHDNAGGWIKFWSWEVEEDVKVLRLKWITKNACEDTKDAGNGSGSGHWGFFTWLIIIVFMGVAAYLIFGSWLNYNRYSARGWDLVPHSETIRDVPYLLRDWMRRVLNTVQGGGSRGGYSAV